MTETSFRKRPPGPGDPVVCNDIAGGCGETLGSREFLDTPEKLAAREREHAPEHCRRIEHQRRHRTLADPCPDCRVPPAAPPFSPCQSRCVLAAPHPGRPCVDGYGGLV